VSSGTDALLIALMVLGVGAGDEVIVPAYSFFATAGVVDRLGATPVFVDIDLADYNIDPKLIEAKITPRTKAVMPVHLYGQCAAMDEINAIAAKHHLPVIEDAAQAVGAEFDGRRAGSLSLLGCFSFFPSKNLGAFGDAGAVTTGDEALKEKLIDFRVHGMRPKYFHKYVGGNFRIDALQAAILHVKLPHLDEWADGRRRNAARYDALFAEAKIGERVVLPRELPRRHHIFNQYIVRFEGREARDGVLEHLKSKAIGCEVYYPLTLPQQECFSNVPCAKDAYPNSDAAAAQTLAIPIFPELTEAQQAEVVQEIANALGS
jgi:dTDP-4-amino-4,6-dideoxygalactose transaminase